MLSLYLAAARIRSSTELTTISLSTRTSFFCPSLQILVRIPVRVEDDHCVCCLKVQPQSAGSCGEDEDEVVAVLLVEICQHVSPVVRLGCSIKPEVGISSPV